MMDDEVAALVIDNGSGKRFKGIEGAEIFVASVKQPGFKENNFSSKNWKMFFIARFLRTKIQFPSPLIVIQLIHSNNIFKLPTQIIILYALANLSTSVDIKDLLTIELKNTGGTLPVKFIPILTFARFT